MQLFLVLDVILDKNHLHYFKTDSTKKIEKSRNNIRYNCQIFNIRFIFTSEEDRDDTMINRF